MRIARPNAEISFAEEKIPPALWECEYESWNGQRSHLRCLFTNIKIPPVLALVVRDHTKRRFACSVERVSHVQRLGDFLFQNLLKVFVACEGFHDVSEDLESGIGVDRCR